MAKFKINPTKLSPEIELDFVGGSLLIKGRSILENSVEFYSPLFSQIDSYVTRPAKITTIDFKLEYFNTSSSKCIFDIMKKFKCIQERGLDIEINWYYDKDDEEVFEIGQDFSRMINIPFSLKVLASV